MVLPFDDHMVHRGHGVFDTAYVHEGRAYQLDRHLDRFIRSTESAKIPLLLLPATTTRRKMMMPRAAEDTQEPRRASSIAIRSARSSSEPSPRAAYATPRCVSTPARAPAGSP